MEELGVTILAGILMIAIYVGAPTLLILGLLKWRKHRRTAVKTENKRPYKLLSVPLLVLNAVPACGIVLRENAAFNLERTNEEFWYMLMTFFFYSRGGDHSASVQMERHLDQYCTIPCRNCSGNCGRELYSDFPWDVSGADGSRGNGRFFPQRKGDDFLSKG